MHYYKLKNIRILAVDPPKKMHFNSTFRTFFSLIVGSNFFRCATNASWASNTPIFGSVWMMRPDGIETTNDKPMEKGLCSGRPIPIADRAICRRIVALIGGWRRLSVVMAGMPKIVGRPTKKQYRMNAKPDAKGGAFPAFDKPPKSKKRRQGQSQKTVSP